MLTPLFILASLFAFLILLKRTSRKAKVIDTYIREYPMGEISGADAALAVTRRRKNEQI